MQTIECAAWADFDRVLSVVSERHEELETTHQRQFFPPLYRGLGNGDWGLQTTLDRAVPFEMAEPISDLARYFEYAFIAKPAIETFTGQHWDDVPFPHELGDKLTSSRDSREFFNRYLGVYRYFVYLRHHGFPSPLLDWTASPYIAAFFAFDGMCPDAKTVSIHAILKDTMMRSSEGMPGITLLGQYIRSHPRHMIQQSRYTICTLWRPEYRICSHEEVMDEGGTLGIGGEMIRITMPASASERSKALNRLDLMNINSYSLYGSEDSLVRAIARREGLFW